MRGWPSSVRLPVTEAALNTPLGSQRDQVLERKDHARIAPRIREVIGEVRALRLFLRRLLSAQGESQQGKRRGTGHQVGVYVFTGQGVTIKVKANANHGADQHQDKQASQHFSRFA